MACTEVNVIHTPGFIAGDTLAIWIPLKHYYRWGGLIHATDLAHNEYFKVLKVDDFTTLTVEYPEEVAEMGKMDMEDVR